MKIHLLEQESQKFGGIFHHYTPTTGNPFSQHVSQQSLGLK